MCARELAAALLLLAGRTAEPFDCNGNGRDDYLDVARGESLDCNANHVPDECDVREVNYGLSLEQEISTDWPTLASQLLVADLDGDGAPDLVSVHASGNRVIYVWNNGSNGFEAVPQPSNGSELLLADAADLDGDGDLDVLLTGNRAVLTLRNHGRRQFSAWGVQPLDFQPLAAVACDLDRADGAMDLAVIGRFRVTRLRGDGASFVEAATVLLGSDPLALRALDADRDGDCDLVTGNQLGNVSILLNAEGTLASPRNYSAGGAVRSFKAADLDGDGSRDLAALVTAEDGNATAVLANAGKGEFLKYSLHPLPDAPFALEIGDLDGDADLDVVTLGQALSLLANHGSGVLGPAIPLLSTGPVAMAAADLEGDGVLEILLKGADLGISVLRRSARTNSRDCNADGIPDECQLVENDCNANRTPDECDLAGGASQDCNLNEKPDECEGDCNGNRHPDDCDLTAGRSADCNGNGAPDECDLEPVVAFAPPVRLDVIFRHGSLDLLDLEGDGDLDLVTEVFSIGIRSFANGGDGTFAQPRDQAVPGGPAEILLVADLEGDGATDLVVGGRGFVAAARNDGQGVFGDGPRVAVDGALGAVAAADLDGDGDLDLAAGTRERGRFTVTIHVLGAGGEFAPAGSLPPLIVDGDPPQLLAADFDGDGDLDLATFLYQAIQTFHNDGAARFPSVTSSRGGRGSAQSPADFDGDGDLDVLDGTLVLWNRGDGSFAEETVASGLAPSRLAPADADLDGDPDIFVTMIEEDHCLFLTTYLSLLVNDGAGGFLEQGRTRVDGSRPFHIAAGDLEGNGSPDVALVTFRGGSCGELEPGSKLLTIPSRITPAASRDRNLDAIPDECSGTPFRRGDADASGAVDLTDAIAIVLHLFRGGAAPSCRAAADATDDGRLDLADAIHLLGYLFAGGPAPPHPGPGGRCGVDPDPPGSPGHLPCEAYPGC